MDYYPVLVSGALFTACGVGIISGAIYFSVTLSASLVTEAIVGAAILVLGLCLLLIGVRRKKEEMQTFRDNGGRTSPFYFEIQQTSPFYYELEPTPPKRELPPIPRDIRSDYELSVMDLV